MATAVTVSSIHRSWLETPSPLVFLTSIILLKTAPLGNTANKWGQQIGLDTLFNVMKGFWPDTRRNLSRRCVSRSPIQLRQEGLALPTGARPQDYIDRTFNLVDFLQSQDRIHLSQSKSCEILLLTGEEQSTNSLTSVLVKSTGSLAISTR